MPRKLRLSHKKSHCTNVSAENSSSDTAIDVCTQTDDERNTIDVTTQTDDADVSIDDDGDGDDERDFVNAAVQTDDFDLNPTVSTYSMTTPQADTVVDLMSPMPGSCIIQYPIEIFYSLKLESVYQLKQRLRNAKCIDKWFVLSSDVQSEVVKLVKMDDRQVFTVEVLPNLQWAVCIPNNRLLSSYFKELPTTITAITQLQSILNFFDECKICSGNADPKFAPIVAKCKGLFKDRSG